MSAPDRGTAEVRCSDLRAGVGARGEPLDGRSEPAELCAPGGHVIVSMPFLIRVRQVPFFLMEDYWRFTPRGLRTLLEQVGLEVESVGSWGNRQCVVGNFTALVRLSPVALPSQRARLSGSGLGLRPQRLDQVPEPLRDEHPRISLEVVPAVEPVVELVAVDDPLVPARGRRPGRPPASRGSHSSDGARDSTRSPRGAGESGGGQGRGRADGTSELLM